jgi:hypothetical protein
MIFASVVPGAQVHLYWEQVNPLIEKSIERSGSYDTIEELHDYVVNHYPEFMLVLFTEKHKIVAVSIFQEDNNALNCVAFAGENVLSQAKRLLFLWRTIAHSLGLSKIKLTGRRGWSRVFKNDLVKLGDFYYGRSVRQ